MDRETRNSWHEDSIEWEGGTIPYRYCHSRRRTLGMTVRPDKSVSVRVPLRVSRAAIREFVTRRVPWIVKVWAGFDSQTPAQSYERAARFLFQGTLYPLVFEQGLETSVQLRGDCIVVTAPLEPAPARLRNLVESWYRDRAAELFRERLIACHDRMQLEGAAPPPLLIRPMTSRWGSYSYRTRRVTLNLHLVKVPLPCLDYVIIHELCHAVVRHHGPAFWHLVGRHCPEYPALRRQLATFIPVLH